MLRQVPPDESRDPGHQRSHDEPLPRRLTLISIRPGADAVDPFRMGAVPVNGRGESLFERDGRAPAKLVLGLRAVDGVAAVVAQAIGDVTDQALRLAAERQHRARDVQVIPLAPAAEVIDLTGTTAPE